LVKLVSALKMQMLIEPIAVYSETFGNRGLTAMCALNTSSITMHCWDEKSPGTIHLDVFSCSEIIPEVVWECVSEFGIISMDYKFMDRENGFTDIVR
jgi:S-adenosylmethionine/arginine decarboxylase-like enzyme